MQFLKQFRHWIKKQYSLLCNSKSDIIAIYNDILSSPIEYLKGVGPVKADLLKKELQIFTFGDLLTHFPLRHIDKTKIDQIRDIQVQTDYVQLRAKISSLNLVGAGRGKRLVAYVNDGTGELELVWFQGISWVQKTVTVGGEFLIYGKVSFFNGMPQISHPEVEEIIAGNVPISQYLEPVYPTTEKLKARGVTPKVLAKCMANLFSQLTAANIPENIPASILHHLQLVDRFTAFRQIHFPMDNEAFVQAVRRLKFEELFIAQVRLHLIRLRRNRYSQGFFFSKVGDLFNEFYNNYLPFELTGAQKRVLKEIRRDVAHGHQMNRLVQGDVGSGKTIVAFLAMLLAADNGFQSCLVAPTEILARQHFAGLSELAKDLPINIQCLTGSTKTKERRLIHQALEAGEIHILIGTHAILEDKVKFKNLGLAIIDEQHRFGVAQRAKLWQKNTTPPHILVMTATPIPRTLAMTAYGDLEYSVMDELPPGRKPITTVHRNEMQRASVMEFIGTEIEKGRQAYIIYPLIEESEKLSYEDLMQGYEQVKSWFPEPKYRISMVHGRQPQDQKDTNMQRFVDGDTQIMVSTTVIEVGVNVPNASVMVIESSEKFGLSQLHQLRGRVGRGSEQSYCILITGQKLSNEGRERIKIMCQTNDGFKIAEKDLELRGPGDIEGTRQSGALNFKIASIIEDRVILQTAKEYADQIVSADESLVQPENAGLKSYLEAQKGSTAWSKIS